jgi:ADP-heptose:LPS heptosyltransferase
VSGRGILVIKLGALGDFILAFPAYAAIRAHHPGERITLLTTAPFAELARRSKWFDDVSIDRRPSWWNLPALCRLARQLRGFDFVYDLQTSGRSSRYFQLAGRPPWSGIAPGVSHPHTNPQRNHMHTLERQRDQLAMAGITGFPAPDLDWLREPPPQAPLPPRFALLVPGAAAHRPAKRWPAAHFAALAQHLAERGLRPVVIGGAGEAALGAEIGRACPTALDLTGRTTPAELGPIAARATLAVGNDTGPMHLIAALGCPSVVLFSGESDPALTAPRGDVRVLREANLADLPVERVAATLPCRH